MSKKSGYSSTRSGRSSVQTTGTAVKKTPDAYASHGTTEDDRTQGRLAKQARDRGWSVDVSELGTRQMRFSRGAHVDVVVSRSSTGMVGSLVSRDPKHKVGVENEARMRFDVSRGIPTPGQVRTAFEQRRLRRSGG